MKIRLLSIITIFILFTACNSDDENIDPSRLVSNYQEPNLNLGIFKEDFLIQESAPDEEFGSFLNYNFPQNGIVSFTYVFREDTLTNDVYFAHVNVHIYDNRQNLNYILGFLTNKYGETELQDFGGNGSGYVWDVENQGLNMRIQLVLDPEDGDGLFFIDYALLI